MGAPPPPLFLPGSEPLWEEAFGRCPSFSVAGASPALPPPCFPLQSTMAWGHPEQVVGTGRERKAGGRKGGPVKGQNLSGRNISADTARRNNQTQLPARAAECQAASHLCVGWGRVREEQGEEEGDAHLSPELLSIAVCPCLGAPNPSVSQI